MAQYPIYNPQYGIYNPNNFSKQTSGGDALTVDTGKLYFLQFPNAQTTQTEFLHSIGVASDATFNGPVTFNETVTYEQDIEYKQNVMVDGDATIIGNLLGETGTFQNVLTCEKGIDISVAPYGITFPDNTTQTTAFIEANYAQLNTDNTFLAPYVQTFQQNNSTTPATAPIQINNITNSDNIALYIDPSSGNDLTLYSSQATGGLTVRNPTASFTLNPVTISPGIVGAQTLNPIDMNGYNLLGLTNVYADGNGMTFIDSANAPMLQLTNGGHTSYENLNMNSSTIYGASSISSPIFYVGNYGQITNQTTENPQILVLRNTYNNSGNNAQFYFQINDTSNNPVSPLQINWNGINSTVGLNMNNQSITNINSISGNSTSNITCNSTIGMATGKSINMNNNSILLISSLSGGSGTTPITINSPLSMSSGSNIAMNNNNITSIGSGSTAYTQPNGTSNTSIATTQYVQNMFVTQTIGLAANNAYYAITPQFNSFVASYITLDSNQYQVTLNTLLSTSNPVQLQTNGSMPVNTVDTITLTYTSGVTVPWASSTGTFFGKIILENTTTLTQVQVKVTIFNNAVVMTLPTLTYLIPSTNYYIYFIKSNVTV